MMKYFIAHMEQTVQILKSLLMFLHTYALKGLKNNANWLPRTAKFNTEEKKYSDL